MTFILFIAIFFKNSSKFLWTTTSLGKFVVVNVISIIHSDLFEGLFIYEEPREKYVLNM